MRFDIVTAEERESLYNEVWTEPVTEVAKRYEISDVALRKRCIKLGIPLPPSGYWARVRAGQKVPKTLLPKVTGDLKKVIRNYVIRYKTDIKNLSDQELMADEELSLLSDETKGFIHEMCSKVQVKNQLRDPNPMIKAHKEEMDYRHKRDKALKRADFNTNYYYHVKSQYRDNKTVMPVYVSESHINRVYRIIDTIIKTLDEMEGAANVTQVYQKDEAYFYVFHEWFYFDVKEESKKKRNVKNEDSQAKTYIKLTLTNRQSGNVTNAYEFIDCEENPLENQIGKIIYGMFVAANRLNALSELEHRESECKWAEQQRKWRLEEMRKGELKEIKDLELAASDWEKAERIRKFADAVELRIADVVEGEVKEELLKWLQWARNKADWIDPLIAKEDELLGKNKHLFDSIINGK